MPQTIQLPRSWWPLLVIGVFAVTWTWRHSQVSGWWWFWVGVGIGVVALWLDELWLRHRSWRWLELPEPVLLSRSLLMVGLLMCLWVFVVTSTRSLLAIGLTSTWCIGVAAEIWTWRHDQAFMQRFLGQLKVKTWSPGHQLWLAKAALSVVLVLTLLSLV